MSTTLTIKQVPDQLAARLRRRAAHNRRSLQSELLLIVEHASEEAGAQNVAEPAPPVYQSRSVSAAGKSARKSRTDKPPSGRLSLGALWQRAHKLGAPMPAESADLIRHDRDSRHGH